MDPDPSVRTTFWSSIFSGIFVHSCHAAITAGALQRYMSLRDEKQARISTFIAILGSVIIALISGLTGLIIYAKYSSCDPVLNKDVSSPNQILPFFVTTTIGHIPGFSGFFIAGLLSAAMSTLSSELNMAGGIVYYDFVLKYYKTKFTKNKGTLIMKIVVVVLGFLYLISVPLLQNSSHIYELAISIAGITYGARFGMMLLAILVPQSNSKGVFVGAISSMVIMTWTNYGSHTYHINSYYKMETSVENCTNVFNFTSVPNISNITTSTNEPKLEDIFFLYRLSYLYYALFGTLINVIVGIVVSYITGLNNIQTVDPLHIAPFLRSYVQKQKKVDMEMEQNH